MQRSTLLIAVLLPLLLAAQQAERTRDNSAFSPPRDLQEDVNAGNQDWVEGLKAGDAKRIVASYAEDCVSCDVEGGCLKGRSAIAAQYQQAISKLGRANDASVRSNSLRVDHDLAYESGEAEARYPNGTVRKGRFSTVWKLQPDGHWKIFRNMSLPPSP